MGNLTFFLYKLASPAFAASNCPPGSTTYNDGILKGLPCDRPVNDVWTTVMAIKNLITNVLLPVVGVIFSIMFIVGSILYITSNGNQQRVDQGKKTLTYAIGGLILVILAEVLIGLFAALLGGALQ
jgi:hypothetical protein